MKKNIFFVLGYIMLCVSYLLITSIVAIAFVSVGRSIIHEIINICLSSLHIGICIVVGVYCGHKSISKICYMIILFIALLYSIIIFVRIGYFNNPYGIYLQIFPIIYALILSFMRIVSRGRFS